MSKNTCWGAGAASPRRYAKHVKETYSIPFILSLIAIAGAAFFWFNRAQNANDTATDLLDAAKDVRLAARRFGFKRRTNVHPVDDIEDPNVAIATIATAFLELDDLPTQNQRYQLAIQLQYQLNQDPKDAGELMVLGRWLMMQCERPDAAISRVTRRLYKFDGVQSVEPLMTVLKNLAGEKLSGSQTDSLAEITRALRLN